MSLVGGDVVEAGVELLLVGLHVLAQVIQRKGRVCEHIQHWKRVVLWSTCVHSRACLAEEDRVRRVALHLVRVPSFGLRLDEVVARRRSRTRVGLRIDEDVGAELAVGASLG